MNSLCTIMDSIDTDQSQMMSVRELAARVSAGEIPEKVEVRGIENGWFIAVTYPEPEGEVLIRTTRVRKRLLRVFGSLSGAASCLSSTGIDRFCVDTTDSDLSRPSLIAEPGPMDEKIAAEILRGLK